MEESRALMQLLEAADLIAMVDEITATSRGEMSPRMRAGIRITLKNARESILAGHDSIAAELCHQKTVSKAPTNQPAPHQAAPKMERRDLRATIEKFIEPSE